MPEVEGPRLAKCGRCDQIFVKLRAPVCESCQPDEEADCARIREVLAETQSLSIDELAETAGVEVKCVLRMLDQGMLAGEGPASGINCGKCGAPALSVTQRLCLACLLDLDRRLSEELIAAKKSQPRPKRSVVHQVHVVLSDKRKQ